jgi:prefoldin subunit 5
MAFNFLGTFSLEQLRELRNFLVSEVESFDQQINSLRIELNKLKTTRTELVTADSNFGGNVLQSIFETELPPIVKVPKQDDTNSATLIEKVKRPFISTIKYKRERIEYKIKKLTDTVEQMSEMIDRKAIAKTQTTQLLDEVERMFNDQNKNHLFQTTDDMKNFFAGKVA